MLCTTFVASFIRNGRVTALLQPSEVDCLTAKHFNWQSFFFLILIHFLRTPFGPREWLAVCGLVYLVYLFFSYLNHALLDFSKTDTTFYLMHTLQVQQFSELSCHLILFHSILYTAE